MASSDNERVNFIKISNLVVDVGRESLKNVFDGFHPPANLQASLNANIKILNFLKSKNILKTNQYDLLFPASGKATSNSFDTSLLFILVRNICGLAAPATGWIKDPSDKDYSREADIVRIKNCRNSLCHNPTCKLSDHEFKTQWKKMKEVLIRLGGMVLESKIDHLEVATVDGDAEKNMKILSQAWEEEENLQRNKLSEIFLTLEKVNQNMENLTIKVNMLLTSDGTENNASWEEGNDFILRRYEDDPQRTLDSLNTAILMLGAFTLGTAFGALVYRVTKGSFKILIAIRSIRELDKLMERYRNNELKKNLEEVLITDDLLKLAPANTDKIGLSLEISEQEYLDIRSSLIQRAVNTATEIIMDIQSNEEYDAARLPSLPRHFTGRTKLRRQISDMAIKENYQLFFVTGPPGYGKSSLAVVTGHTLQMDYGFLVLYFDFKDCTTLYQACVLVLETLLKVSSADPIQQIIFFLKSKLKQRKTLLIFDNTENLQENQNVVFLTFLEDICKFSTDMHVIITSQAMAQRRHFPFFTHTIPLEPLNDKESLELWRKLTQDFQCNFQDFTIQQLCKACMGIPIFLEMAVAHYQHNADKTLLIKDLETKPKLLLGREQISGKMKVFLSRIPQALKITLAKMACFPGWFSFAEANSIFNKATENFPFREELINLCNYSLLNLDEDTGKYKLPNFVQSAVTKAKLDDTLYNHYTQAVIEYVDFYMGTVQQLSALFISHDNGKALNCYFESKHNIFHAFKLAIDHKQIQVVDVSTEVVNFLAKCLNIEDFVKVYGGLSALVQEDDKRHSDCLTSLGFKYLCYHGRDNNRIAENYLKQACRLQQRCHAVNTTEGAHAMSKLGLCKVNAGQIEQGIRLIVKATIIKKELYSREEGTNNKMLIGGGYCDLAMAISKFNTKAAVKIWKNISLKIYQEILHTHPFTATLLQYIGEGHHKQQQYYQAENFKRQSLEMRKDLLGEYHQDTARSYSSLAITLESVGKVDEAFEMWKKTKHIQSRHCGSPEDIKHTNEQIQRLQQVL